MSDFSYEFSRLCLCDLDDLVALEKICFPHAWTEQQFWLCLKQKQYYIFGLKKRGELATYMSFFNVADEMEILKLAVHPAHRRKGLGKRLLGLVLQNCIEMGIEQAYLEVRRSNTSGPCSVHRIWFYSNRHQERVLSRQQGGRLNSFLRP